MVCNFPSVAAKPTTRTGTVYRAVPWIGGEIFMWDFPDAESLDGSFVTLERIHPAKHTHDLFEMATKENEDHSIFRFMMFGPFHEENEIRQWIETQESLTDRVVYSVYSKRLKKYVGTYSVLNIDRTSGKAEVGSIWYGKAAQRTEINSEATFIVLQYLFERLSYRRVEWKCDSTNEASKRSALRMGFSYEGLFRKHMVVRGRNRDTVWFSIIDEEWPEKKRRFLDDLIRRYRE
jgi:RimJ/RimL family protein N-acetyltransferase